ncbi:right-handed parallel beta-helix repeat-containing protein, partial [Nanoarchaeota archaeon]
MYKNADLLASGPPDVMFDGSADSSSAGGTVDEAWRFGSSGPEIYDSVLIGVPYNSTLDTSTMNVTIVNLYDDDLNLIWNVSVNGTNPGATLTDYADYNQSWFTGMPCSTTDTSADCYINETSGFVWMSIPHFSVNEPVVSGQESSQDVINVSVDKVANVTNASEIGVVDFTINITNTGDVNISNVTVLDWFNMSEWTFNQSEPNTSGYWQSGGISYNEWNITVNLSAGETYLLNLTLGVYAVGGNNITNDVNVTVRYANGSEQVMYSNATVEILSTPAPEAVNLTFTKTVVQSSVENDSTAQFILNVTNIGSVNATDFMLLDDYNVSMLNYSGADVTPGTINYSGGELDWEFNLTTGNSYVVTVNFTTLQPGNTTNSADAVNSTDDTIASDTADLEITLAPLANGSVCTADGQCLSDNCVLSPDESTEYCAGATKECGQSGGDGYDTNENVSNNTCQADGSWLCIGGYYNSGSACVAASVGYYSSANNDTQYSCSAGDYSEGTASSCTTCEADFYCIGAADRAACTAYSDTDGNSGSDAGTDCHCDAGYFDVNGDTGGRLCNSTFAGYYSLDNNDGQAQCAAGRYGTGGSVNGSCTGECSGGYYCPAASTSATENGCPADNYCTSGVGSPTACTATIAPPLSDESGDCKSSNVTVVKTTLESPIWENETASFMLNITNMGGYNATLNNITDYYTVSEFNYSATSMTANDTSDGNVVWYLDTILEPAESQVIYLNLTPESNDTFTNYLNVTSSDINGNVTIGQDSSSITVNSTPAAAPDVVNLTFTKTVVQASVTNGTTAQFTLNVTNVGSVDATDFMLLDDYNFSMLDYTGANVTPIINESIGELDWEFNLTTGNSYVVTVNFTTLQPGNTTNSADVVNSTDDTIASDTADVEINSSALACGDTITTSTTLTGDLSQTGAGNCLTVGAGDVVIDCAGFTMDGTDAGGSYGVFSDVDWSNVTVRNCNISDFNYGIFWQGVDDSLIYNNTFTSNADTGVYLTSSAVNNNVESNVFVGSGGRGIAVVSGSNNAYIWDNSISSCGTDGIYLSGSSGADILNNTVTGNSDDGIEVESSSSGITIANNTLNSNGGQQLRVASSSAVIWDQSVSGSYEFSSADLEFVSSGVGRLRFLNSSVTAISESDLDADIVISAGSVYVNSTDVTGFDNPANITLYDTDSFGFTERVPYVDGDMCSDSVCTELSDADTYVFNVTGFSNYSVGELYLNCGETINSSINLTRDISISGAGNCLTVGASDIIIDCAGFTMDGTDAGGSYGVFSDVDWSNVTVRNCNISDFNYGIFWQGVDDSLIYNNTFTSNADTGVYLTSSALNNNVESNVFVNSGSRGIAVVAGSNNAYIWDNSISGCGTDGIYLSASSGADILNNTVTVTGDDGIEVESSSLGVTIANNTLSVNVGQQLRVANSSAVIWDQSVSGSYEFSSADLEFVSSGVGRLRFLNSSVTAISESDLDADIVISAGSVFVNSTDVTGLNNSANITLYNITYTKPVIEVDTDDDGTFAPCNSGTSPACYNVSYSGDTFVFNVSHFTTYRVVEALACGDTITTNTTLTENLSMTGAGTCLTVGAAGVVLDCAGFAIEGDDSSVSYGVQVAALSGFVLKGCDVVDFTYGVQLNNADGAWLYNSTVRSGNTGVYVLNGADNVVVESCDVLSNNYGIYAADSAGLDVLYSLFNDSGTDGVYLNNCDSAILLNNTVSSNGDDGFHFDNTADGALVGNNSFSGSGDRDVEIVSSVGAVLRDQSLGSYSFLNSGLSVEESGVGKIAWLNSSISDNGVNFSDDVQIGTNSITVKITYTGQFNSPADLTFYDTDALGLTDRIPYVGGERCSSPVCTEISDSDTYVFNLTYFTNNTAYSVGEFYTDCGDTITSNTTLTQSINMTGAGTCLTVGATGVVLDCAGYTISGNDSSVSYGVQVAALSGFVLKGCDVVDFTYGVQLNNADGAWLYNSTVRSGNAAVYVLNGADNVVVESCDVLSNNYGIYAADSAGLDVLYSLFNDSGTDGVYLNNCDSAILLNNTVSSNGDDGFHFDNTADGALVGNNSFSGSGDRDVEIVSSVGAVLRDQSLGSYSFLNSGLSVEESGVGSIAFLNTSITESGTNFADDVQIGSNSIFVNSSAQPGFNVSADLTLHGLGYTNPMVEVDPEDDSSYTTCNSTTDPACYNLSYSGGTFVFNVSHFTSYRAAETPLLANGSVCTADGDCSSDNCELGPAETTSYCAGATKECGQSGGDGYDTNENVSNNTCQADGSWLCIGGYFNVGSGCVAAAVGAYSPANNDSHINCSATTYTGSVAQDSCTTCEADFYCLGAADRAACTASSDTDGNTGSAADTDCHCDAGYYDSNGDTGGRSCAITLAGYYSLDNNEDQTVCDAGYYGTGGSTDANCDGACTAGYYCPAASTSATETGCPADNYCTSGVGSPTACTATIAPPLSDASNDCKSSNVTVVKTTLDSPIWENETARFMLNITNMGGYNATLNNVTDYYTVSEFNYSSTSLAANDTTDGYVDWYLDIVLEPAESQVIYLNLTPESNDTFTNYVNVTSSDINGNASLAQDSSSITVNATPAPPPDVVNLTLTKTVVNSSVEEGDTAQFILNVTNVGEVNVTGYMLMDDYNTTFLNYSGASPAADTINYSGGQLDWDLDLNVGNSYVVTVNFTTLTVGNTTNSADVANDSDDTIASDTADVEITEPPLACGDVITTNTTLTENLSITGAGVTCLSVGADDVILDCAGYTIDGDDSNNQMGVYVNGFDGVTVKNCVITDFYASVLFAGSDNGLVYNNTISSSYLGVYLMSESDNITIESNTMSDCNQSVDALSNSDYVIIRYNSITDSDRDGILLQNSLGGEIRNNTISNSGESGIQLDASANDAVIANNTLSGSGWFDLELVDNYGTLLWDQSISDYYLANAGLSVESSGVGKLEFINTSMTASGVDLSADVQITSNSIVVTLTGSEGLDNSANLTFYDTDSLSLTDRIPYIGGEKCTSSTCTEISDADTYVFNVTGFTNNTAYSVGESYGDCGDIITTSTTLTQSINVSGAGATCLGVAADDIIIDCAGYTITGDDANNGIGVNVSGHDNVTVKNCVINDLMFSIYYSDSDLGTVSNNTISSGSSGIYFVSGSDNNTAEDNDILNCTNLGIGTDGSSDYPVIQDNFVNGSVLYGIYLANSVGGELTGNTIDEVSAGQGMRFTNVIGATLTSNTINNSLVGINASQFNDSTWTGNTILNSQYTGFYCSDCDNNAISGGEIGNNNVANDTEHGGIMLTSGSTGNTISGAYLHDNAQLGAISLSESNSNTISGNNIDSNCGNVRQIRVYESNNTIIQDNNITDGTGYGIEIDFSSYTTIYNNLISGNADNAVIETMSGFNYGTNITSNVIRDNIGGVQLYSERDVIIDDNDFINNSDYAVYAFGASTFNLTNNDFVDNTPEGMYGTNASSLNWVVDQAVNCTNNNITIQNGSLTGGDYINRVNCTVTVNGVVLDTADPTVELLSPANNTETNNSTVTFQINATDNMGSIANCTLLLDDNDNETLTSVTSGALTSFTPMVLADGSYNWTVACKDDSDNEGEGDVFYLEVDASAPTTSDDAPAGWQTSAFFVSLTCNDSSGTGCDYTTY